MVSPKAPQPLLVVVFLTCPAVSLAVTFPVAAVTDHLCTRVRRGILLLVLVLGIALALALALLPFAFCRRLAFEDSADVHRYQTWQFVAGHAYASYFLSYKGIR